MLIITFLRNKSEFSTYLIDHDYFQICMKWWVNHTKLFSETLDIQYFIWIHNVFLKNVVLTHLSQNNNFQLGAKIILKTDAIICNLGWIDTKMNSASLKPYTIWFAYCASQNFCPPPSFEITILNLSSNRYQKQIRWPSNLQSWYVKLINCPFTCVAFGREGIMETKKFSGWIRWDVEERVEG